MKRKKFEDSILAYLDGTLPESDRHAFEACMRDSAECRELFNEYQALMQLEHELGSEAPELHPGFSAKVLERIDSDTGFFRGIMNSIRSRHALAAIASVACVALGLHLMLANQSLLFSRQNVIDAFSPWPKSEPAKTELAASIKGKNYHVAGESKPARVEEETAESGVSDPAPLPAPQQQQALLDADSSRELSQQQAGAGRLQTPSRVDSLKSSSKKPARREGHVAVYNDRRLSENSELRQNSPPLAIAKRGIAGRNDGSATGTKELRLNENAPGFRKERFEQVAPGDVSQQWEENRRTAVADEPLSTFSIDVDTGSYTYARRFLQQGSLPPADSVRIEEFLNYFQYSYEEPKNEPFALTYEMAPSPLEQDRYLLRLGIKARPAADDTPWNLVFLIDVSGSMGSPDKLGLVQSALADLVRNMRSQDRVAIVTYAGRSGVLLKSTGVDKKAAIIRAIQSLGAGGSTHGSAGIETAYAIADSNMIDGAVNRVVLLTDGDFNVGTTSHEALIELIKNKRESGITLTTVGVGTGNYHEALMEQLANKGNGNYFYLDSLEEAKKVFGKELAGTMEVVAKDVKLQVEFNPAVVSLYRLIGYDNRKLRTEDFNNDAVDAGEIGSGHTVTALYELVLTDSELAERLSPARRYGTKEQSSRKNTHDEVGFLKIRYKQPDGQKSILRTFPLATERLQKSVNSTSADFRFAAAVSYFGHKLRKSSYGGDYSFAAIKELAESATGSDAEGYRREFINLIPSE